ncbi:hypothetical protein Gotri_013217 [Gossypium trilobum]|uniref:J domain-containing protein n=1 Tax=Gossypium trilobum TaxID=34281 RepID=A0A7J9DSV0_9ROSI|nr:hypothetical protein [Gossypium trilobum]
MKEIATENFQRIFEAYKILSDENKRQIYDIMIELVLGLESSIMVGWKMKEDNMSAGGDVNVSQCSLFLSPNLLQNN